MRWRRMTRIFLTVLWGRALDETTEREVCAFLSLPVCVSRPDFLNGNAAAGVMFTINFCGGIYIGVALGFIIVHYYIECGYAVLNAECSGVGVRGFCGEKYGAG